MVALKVFHSRALHTDGWWWIECIDAPGANSQMRSLADLDDHKEAIEHITGTPQAEIEIELEVDLQGGDDGKKLKRYVELANQLSKLNREFSGLQIELTANLVRNARFSYRDVAKILRISHQRIGQLMASLRN